MIRHLYVFECFTNLNITSRNLVEMPHSKPNSCFQALHPVDCSKLQWCQASG